MSPDRQPYPRLEAQIDWYDRKSVFHQRWYRRLKVLSIAAAALVPLVSGLTDYPLLAGLLGVVVVIAEGLQHVNQHHDNWVRYRATCEDLRHEKYLYEARAGGYEELADDEAFRMLATNVEMLLSREGEAWLKMQRDAAERKAKTPQASAD